jgi:hypothetical protein
LAWVDGTSFLQVPIHAFYLQAMQHAHCLSVKAAQEKFADNSKGYNFSFTK